MSTTIKDVARLAGLSVGTVSKYINGQKVKEKTRIAIEDAIETLNFRPNNIAKGLRNSKSYSVAILMPRLDSLFCTSMVSSIESTLLPRGYSVIVCECHDDAEMELEKAKFLIDKMVDGVILIPYSHEAKVIKLFHKNNIPVVVLDQELSNYKTDCVVLDNECAGYEPVKHIINKGHDNIGIIIGNPNHYTTKGRLEGYKKALINSGKDIKEEYIQYGNYTIDGGYESMLRLCNLRNRPSAVFISNYDMTIGAYLAINYLDLKIPEDISVFGFDNFPLSNVVKPALSFVGQPIEKMGRDAGELMYKRMKKNYSDFPATIVHSPDIYYKESVKNLLTPSL